MNDIFDFFHDTYYRSTNSIFEIVHILMHADDATMIASSREVAINNLKSFLQYCNRNYVVTQYSKCEFIAINGNAADVAPSV